MFTAGTITGKDVGMVSSPISYFGGKRDCPEFS